MTGDPAAIIAWWVLFLFLGISVYPITHRFFGRFFDTGYGFAKTIGLLLVSYTFFIANSLKILPFNQIFLILTLLSIATFNYFVFTKNKTKIITSIKKHKRIIVIQEVLFLFGLLLWSYVRAHQPDIAGLEKFMDFGFINSLLRTEFLPPADMWFSGNSINYYWFGHYMVALVTKLSGIPSAVTYNLMLATIVGLTLTSAFSIASTLTKTLKKITPKTAVAAGLISAILLTFGGNFHTPVFTFLEGADKYWYPDATRFIGYNPDVNDKTIHEFPMYSFVVSDLHAHLINLPTVLLYIGLLLLIVKNSKEGKLGIKSAVPLGFLLGIMFMTSAWDTGNYLLLGGIVILFFNVFKQGFGIRATFETAKLIVPAIIIATIVVSPFLINFESIAQGVALVNSKSKLWQLAVLWGFPAVMTVIYLWSMRNKKVKSIDIFVGGVITTIWILITIPEFFYVKDIYIASHHRANTMFKLTYQAFVMSYLLAGYIAAKVISSERNIRIKYLKKLVFFALFAGILMYPKYSVGSYYNDLKNYNGLRGDTWASERYPDEYAVIEWFSQNVSGQPVILEAPGDSYTEYNIISSYTGLPTVSGWFVHEWLWRGDSSFPQQRVSDISLIYTSPDINLTRSLLEKYEVKYVIIGKNEREKYPTINETKFNQIGDAVFSSGIAKVYKVPKS